MGARHLSRDHNTHLLLVQGEVTDYGVTWSAAAKKLSQYQEFQTYTDIFGLDSAQRLFR